MNGIFFKKCVGVLCRAVVMRCRAIRAHTGHVPVRLMCRTLAVSSSGYYAWVARPASRRTAEKRRLVAEILVIHAAGSKPSHRIWGSLFRLECDETVGWPVTAQPAYGTCDNDLDDSITSHF